MSYCPKCGTKVSEKMAFCPECGAPLKAEKPPTEPAPPAGYRPEKEEKAEKHEKGEKREKTEKHEKREFGVLVPLIGGLILICLGIMSYLQVAGFFGREVVGAFFLFIIGILIIVGAIVALGRHPRT